VSGQSAGRRKFDVWPTPVGAEDLKGLRGRADKAAFQTIKRLQQQGCAAANYRLSGKEVERICVCTLYADWRMIVAFPTAKEVAILIVGRHQPKDASRDVYARLYQALGIEVPTVERRRPPCCADDQPPVDPGLVDRFVSRSAELARRARRS
jgi:hypothetical protein